MVWFFYFSCSLAACAKVTMLSPFLRLRALTHVFLFIAFFSHTFNRSQLRWWHYNAFLIKFLQAREYKIHLQSINEIIWYRYYKICFSFKVIIIFLSIIAVWRKYKYEDNFVCTFFYILILWSISWLQLGKWESFAINV